MALELVLASTSPRRRELLSHAGLVFRVLVPDADETPRKGEAPRALVSRLSRIKAESALRSAAADCLEGVVLAADTIVVEPTGKRILNKPGSPAEAERMVRSLSGRTHTVFTAYHLIRFRAGRPVSRRSRVVSTKVTIRKLTNLEIREYVQSGESSDKAGAYAAQGRGMTLIERISGSYTNVVGLPVAEVLVDLKSIGGGR